MSAELNLQMYWKQATLYLALTLFALIALNWVIINAVAEDRNKAKLRRIALTDAAMFAVIPPVFYFLAPYASDIMAAVGTATEHFRAFVSLIHISIGTGVMCYLILGLFVLWKIPEDKNI